MQDEKNASILFGPCDMRGPTKEQALGEFSHVKHPVIVLEDIL